MIFSVSHHSKHKTIADEIKCPYNQLGTIINLIKDNPQKRINITINLVTDEELNKAMEQIDYIKAIAEDYTVECGAIRVLHTLLIKGYKAYLKFPVSDWETFQQLITLGVSDIYIDGPLGFSMNHIINAKGNTRIRVSPTISPNASLIEIRPITSFFIRPEDLALSQYERAIDVIDFRESDQDKEDALYSIYSRGSFNYNLDDLIKNLEEDMNNLFIRSDFAETRTNCRQVCRVPGYKCKFCHNYFNILNHSLELANSPN